MAILENMYDGKGKDKPEVKPVRGRIIKLNKEGGWGFITSKDVPFTRIFFHWTSLVQDTLKFPQLEIGMLVDFIPQDTPEKGTRAIRIKVSEDKE